MSDRELTRDQRLSIGALKRSVKRVIDSGLVVVMQDGSVAIHFSDNYANGDMDCGVHGLKGEDGRYIDPIDSFTGIEH